MAAAIFEHEKQRDLTKKLDALALIKPQEELDHIETLETQKISDALLAEHGFDMVHLEIASEHFNIETDLDLLNYRQ